MDYSAPSNYQQTYNAFGVANLAAPYNFQTALPSGLVPNQATPINPSVLQSGSPFTSEIEMQNGVIYAGVTLFPTNVTNALQSVQSGYRLGLDVKDSNIAKFYIGGNKNFLFWDGKELIISGEIRVYGDQNSITFFDLNGNQQGELFATDTGIVFQSNNELIVASGGNMRIVSNETIVMSSGLPSIDSLIIEPGDGVSINPQVAVTNVPFTLPRLPDNTLATIPFPTNGMMYYDTGLDHIFAYVAGVWQIVI